jgi:hypothetical protein
MAALAANLLPLPALLPTPSNAVAFMSTHGWPNFGASLAGNLLLAAQMQEQQRQQQQQLLLAQQQQQQQRRQQQQQMASMACTAHGAEELMQAAELARAASAPVRGARTGGTGIVEARRARAALGRAGRAGAGAGILCARVALQARTSQLRPALPPPRYQQAPGARQGRERARAGQRRQRRATRRRGRGPARRRLVGAPEPQGRQGRSRAAGGVTCLPGACARTCPATPLFPLGAPRRPAACVAPKQRRLSAPAVLSRHGQRPGGGGTWDPKARLGRPPCACHPHLAYAGPARVRLASRGRPTAARCPTSPPPPPRCGLAPRSRPQTRTRLNRAPTGAAKEKNRLAQQRFRARQKATARARGGRRWQGVLACAARAPTGRRFSCLRLSAGNEKEPCDGVSDVPTTCPVPLITDGGAQGAPLAAGRAGALAGVQPAVRVGRLP